MAHTCHECGSICYWDIDDCMLDTEESYLNCEHYLICEKENNEDDDIYYDEKDREKDAINEIEKDI